MTHVRNSRSPRPATSPARAEISRSHQQKADRAKPVGSQPTHIRHHRGPSAEREPAPERATRYKRKKGVHRSTTRSTTLVRRTPRQERATQTVEAILDAACRLLVERGYAGTSTNAIATRAGVSIGSLYQYFHDKEDVFRGVVHRHRQEVEPVIRTMIERMTHPDADVVALTLDLLREMARVNGRSPRLLAAIDHELGWLEHENEEADEGQARDALSRVLRQRFPAHPFPNDLIATLLVTVIAPFSRWLVHGKPASLDTESLVQAFGCMLRGVLVPTLIPAPR